MFGIKSSITKLVSKFKSKFGSQNHTNKSKSFLKYLILENLENRIVPAAPTNILLSKSTIPENAGINALVGRLSTIDQDSGDTFTYQLQAGPGFLDNSFFHIIDNELRAKINFAANTKDSYTIRIKSIDLNDFSVEKVFKISINSPTGSYSTIQDTGPSKNRVDIVFIGDGYTSSDINNGIYSENTQGYLDYIFGENDLAEPYYKYKDYFNAHQIDIVSNESGADKPPEGIYVDTALDSSYYWDGSTERLLYINSNKADALVNASLAGSGFSPEQRLATVNDPKYGGGGGKWAVFSGVDPNAKEIALHEVGHSFSMLADEYDYADGKFYNGTEPSEVNVTKDLNGSKWSRWIGYNQPGVGIIGAYEGARYFDKGLFRPSFNSKMRSLNQPFDAVSREKIILDIYSHIDPLDGWLANSKPLLDPEYLWVDRIDDSIIHIEWRVDGILIPNAGGSDFDLLDFGYGPGTYSITARAFDPTGFDPVNGWVRTNSSELEETISWKVVNTRPSRFAPLVTTQPAATSVIAGEQAIFRANAIGVPAPLVQWQVSTDGANWQNINGAISSTFITAQTAASDSGKLYRAVFSNTKGTATTASATLTVKFPPTLISANKADFTVGSSGTFQIIATGFPSPTFSIDSGTLPKGITLNSSGTLTGTPGPGTGGTYSLVVKASNGVLTDATQVFTLTVNQAPMIKSANQTTFTTGLFGSFSAFATGFPSPVFSISSGVLPRGISLDASGALTGVPISGAGGTYSFTIKAANGVNPDSTQSFFLVVNQAPTFISSNKATFTAGISNSFKVQTNGFPTATFLIASGNLPTGISLDPSGALTGTPGPGTGGTYSLVVKASNGVLTDATQVFTLTVNQAPIIFSSNKVEFNVNKNTFHQFQATGYPSPIFSKVSGEIPKGLTLGSDGKLQGTPVPGTTGTAIIQITASNAAGTFEQNFSISIGQDGVYAVAVTGGPSQISKLDIYKNGSTQLVRSLIPFPGFKGEFFVDSGDITGDGIDDLIVGSGKGSANGHVVILDGAVLLDAAAHPAPELTYNRGGAVRASFYAFIGYSSGVAVRLADMDDDGFDDIILAPGINAGPQTQSHLRVWNGRKTIAAFENKNEINYDYRWEMASFIAFGGKNYSGGSLSLSTIRQQGADLVIASQQFGNGSKVFKYDGSKVLALEKNLSGNLYLWGSGNNMASIIHDGRQIFASAGTGKITPDTVYIRNELGEVIYRIDKVFGGNLAGLRIGSANVDGDIEDELLVTCDSNSSAKIFKLSTDRAILIDTLASGGLSAWV